MRKRLGPQGDLGALLSEPKPGERLLEPEYAWWVIRERGLACRLAYVSIVSEGEAGAYIDQGFLLGRSQGSGRLYKMPEGDVYRAGRLRELLEIVAAQAKAPVLRGSDVLPGPTARPGSDYHEDYGPVLWWRFPVEEPPYCGSSLDEEFDPEYLVSGFWTPLAFPSFPFPGGQA